MNNEVVRFFTQGRKKNPKTEEFESVETNTENEDTFAKLCADVDQDPPNLRHYIKFESGIMVNPLTRDPRRRFKEEGRWRRVKPQVFALYKQFLLTNKESYLRKAEREFDG
jgi:hypothetical protein